MVSFQGRVLEMSAYTEKLKDPRWQKKRLETLEAHGWKCDFCLKTNKELHVHHDFYNGDPWEVPEDALFVLCSLCHNTIHKIGLKEDTPKAHKRLWTLFLSIKYTDDIEEIKDTIRGIYKMFKESNL